MPEMTPRAFSFNSPHGACPDCQGLGAVYDFDPARLVPDESLSLQDGAIAPWAKGDRKLVREALGSLSRTFGDRSRRCRSAGCRRRCATSCSSAPPAPDDAGTPTARARRSKSREAKDPFGAGFEGLVPNLRRRYEEGTWLEQENLEPYRALRPCPTCGGERLKAQSRAVRVKGRTMSEYVDLPISEAVRVFDDARADAIARR